MGVWLTELERAEAQLAWQAARLQELATRCATQQLRITWLELQVTHVPDKAPALTEEDQGVRTDHAFGPDHADPADRDVA